MKDNMSIKIPLYVIAATLVFSALQSVLHSPAVFSGVSAAEQTTPANQHPASYSYLQPQAGEATESGAKRFIDMRNGYSLICNWHRCVKEGRFPFEDVEKAEK